MNPRNSKLESKPKHLVHLVGAPHVQSSRQTVPLALDQSTFLLTCLASAEGWVSREKISLFLYPDCSTGTARMRVRNLLHYLKTLNLHPAIEADRERLRWRQGSDLHLLRQALAQRNHAEVYRLYPAELLSGFQAEDTEFGSWLVLERQHLFHQWQEAALQHATDLQMASQVQKAAEVLESLLRRDVLHETGLLRLLQLALQTGRAEQAQVFYQQHCSVLRSDLGLEPSDDIRNAAEQLNHVNPRRSAAPSPSPGLVGRKTELLDVERLLRNPEVQLITLHGPGGVGKTRLALEIAQRHPETLFVPCHTLSLEQPLEIHVAAHLGKPLDPHLPFPEALQRLLQQQPLLIILDDVEHLVPQVRALVKSLRSMHHLRFLVTSRESLGMPHEHVVEIGGLPLQPQTPNGSSEAAELFVRRVHAHTPGFSFQDADLQTVERICARLAGVPLALKLAAPWTRVMSLQEILKQLEQDLGFLDGGLPGLPERHQSLRQVFQQTYGLLPGTLREVLLKLSIFPEGFTASAASEVGGAGYRELLALSAHSLLFRSLQHHDAFELHPLVRSFAREEMERQGLQSLLTPKFVNFFSTLVAQGAEELTGPHQQGWKERLWANLANIRQLLLVQAGQQEVLPFLRCCAELWKFWQRQGLHAEGRRWLQLALQKSESQTLPSPDFKRWQAHALLGLGWLSHDVGMKCRPFFSRSLSLFEEVQDLHGQSMALQGLGDSHSQVGEYQQAILHFEEARQHALQVKHQEEWAWATGHLGRTCYLSGQWEQAEQHLTECIHSMVQLGNRWGALLHMVTLLEAQLAQGKLLQVQHKARQMIPEQREPGEPGLVLMLLLSFVGEAALYLGDLEQARAPLEEALQICEAVGYDFHQIKLHKCLLLLALRQGQHQRADQHARRLHDSLKAWWPVQTRMDALMGLFGWCALQGHNRTALVVGGWITHRLSRGERISPQDQQWWETEVVRLCAGLSADEAQGFLQQGSVCSSEDRLDLLLSGMDRFLI